MTLFLTVTTICPGDYKIVEQVGLPSYPVDVSEYDTLPDGDGDLSWWLQDCETSRPSFLSSWRQWIWTLPDGDDAADTDTTVDNIIEVTAKANEVDDGNDFFDHDKGSISESGVTDEVGEPLMNATLTRQSPR